MNTLHSILQTRLRRWQSGEERALWGEYKPESGNRERRVQNAGMAAEVKQARRKAAEGEYSKACQALDSPGVHQLTEEVVAILRDLHPTGAAVRPATGGLPSA